MNLRPTIAEINLDAIQSNFHTLKSLLVDGAFFCPMVKANAYGHGAVQVTKALEKAGARFVGVSLVEEGLELRKAGVEIDILVFGTFYDSESAEECIQASLTPVISTFDQLQVLAEQTSSKNVNVHLKFDTGMSRLGFSMDQISKLKSEVLKVPQLNLQGICTHLAKGEDFGLSEGFSAKQFEHFDKVIQSFADRNVYVHALNSAGLGALACESFKAKYGARPGISLYGQQPIVEKTKLNLKNVMTLKSKIVSSRIIPAGQSVSYSGTWVSKRESLIGVLPIGYADGVPRNLSNNFSVLCRGQRVPVVGTVCMDYVMLDLTSLKSQLPSLGRGEEIVLIGRQGNTELTALEWAQNLGTITYEIFTGISNRVSRVYGST